MGIDHSRARADDVGPEDRAGFADDLLTALRDLEGIWGSFVLSADGALVLWDVPHPITEQALDEVAPRVMRIRDVLAGAGAADASYACVLRFAEHRLCFTSWDHGVVCVLASAAANLAALKMAMTLTLRRLEPLMLSMSTSTSLAPTTD